MAGLSTSNKVSSGQAGASAWYSLVMYGLSLFHYWKQPDIHCCLAKYITVILKPFYPSFQDSWQAMSGITFQLYITLLDVAHLHDKDVGLEYLTEN
jgi:hypothetical protein